MNTQKVSIVIVNWNGENFLPACLESIAANPPSVPFETVVVDNASADGSVAWLRSAETSELGKKLGLKIIESQENLGFGRANNLAIKETESDFIFLLNPDTIVKPYAIDRLLETLESDDKIGAVAPKLLNADGTLQYNVWGFPPTIITLSIQGLRLDRYLPKKWLANRLYSYLWSYDVRTAVPMFSGAAILAKREMVDKVGGFDESFHMYGEDGEWCVRINRNGWETFFEPTAEIVHLGGQSSLQRWGSSNSRIKEEEAFIAFQQKCLSRFHLFCNVLTRLGVLIIHFLRHFIIRNDDSIDRKLITLQLTALKKILTTG